MNRLARVARFALLPALLSVTGCDLFQTYRVWEATYALTGSPSVSSIVATGDSGFAVCGFAYEYGANGSNSSAVLLSIDSNGDSLWCRACGPGEYAQLKSAQVTGDGGFAITGTRGSGSYGTFLIRTDAGGSVLWTRSYADSSWSGITSAYSTADGGFTFAVSGDYDWPGKSLVHTDAAGTILWTAVHSDSGYYYDLADLIPAATGGYLMYGSAWLMRVSATGDSLWTRHYGYGGYYGPYGISTVCATSDGGFFMAGHGYDQRTYESYPLFTRLNADGDTVWTRRLLDSDFENPTDAVETPDGGFVVAGQMKVFLRQPEARLLTLDRNGKVLHARRYGRDENDAFNSVVMAPDGDVVAAGLLNSYSYGDERVMVVKANP